MCFTESESQQGEPVQTRSSVLGKNLSQWWDDWLQSQTTWLWPQWSHWSEKTAFFSGASTCSLTECFFLFSEDGKINQMGKNNNSTCFPLTWQNQGDAGTPKINMGHYKTRTKFSNSSPENENPLTVMLFQIWLYFFSPWKLIWTDMCVSSGDCKSRAHEWPHKQIYMHPR